MPGPIDLSIRSATTDDGEAVARIYDHYVAHTVVTFEEEAAGGAELARRIAEVQAAKLPWLVAARAGSVVGFAYASPWKGRCAYRFSAEVTVYLHPEESRRGIGSRLYGELLPILDARFHVLMAGIALPNEGSVALHEKLGFEKVAHFAEVGWKQGRWIDVAYWQRTRPFTPPAAPLTVSGSS